MRNLFRQPTRSFPLRLSSGQCAIEWPLSFDCGDAPLNTYVAVEEAAPRRVLGYFTIAMSSVPREAFPQKYVRGLPNYDLPLILLARLAVDLRFRGKGIGHALMSEAFRICLRVSGEVGCRCVITDAYRDRMSWYARYGFIPIEGLRAKALSNDSEGTAVSVVDLLVAAGVGRCRGFRLL